jgi:hypothetical protein
LPGLAFVLFQLGKAFMNFKKYNGLSDDSIIGYFFLEGGIIIQFANDCYYLYDYSEPGEEHVERMKV